MGQKSWLNNNEKNVPSYFCQQQKILAYIKAFYTYSTIPVDKHYVMLSIVQHQLLSTMLS